jgi:hypothetical protein
MLAAATKEPEVRAPMLAAATKEPEVRAATRAAAIKKLTRTGRTFELGVREKKFSASASEPARSVAKKSGYRFFGSATRPGKRAAAPPEGQHMEQRGFSAS